MLFSSITFLYCFLPCVLLVYFVVPDRMKNTVLLLASLFFYGWGEPKYLIFMLASVTQSYIAALLVERFRGTKIAKAALAVSAVASLGLLAYCKYADFFIGNFNAVTGLSVPLLRVALPVGISFYTFQILSYVIDVYRGDVPAQRNFIDLAMYVAMFPQLIAGPIVRYSDIAGSLKNRKTTLADASEGITRFSVGLAKKILLANSAALIVSEFKAYGEKTVLFYWLYAAAYMLHIYFDFSGYSDMAIGLGRIFGFRFSENFKYPYVFASITEFWRRWHISLGGWFRDYLYIPLGGNRVSLPRQILNLFIVWGLTGLWHGASWNFVIWGLYYFVFLCLEKFVFKKFIDKIPKIIRWVYSMFVVLVGWMIFYFEDFSAMKSAFSVAFGASGNAFTDPVMNAMIINNIPFIIIAAIACAPIAKLVKAGIAKLKQRAPVTEPIFNTVFNVVMLVLCVASLAGSTYNPFLYFRF